MKLLANRGNERVIDELRAKIGPQARLDVATPAVSLFAFHELRDVLAGLSECRLVLPEGADVGAGLLGEDADRAYRNQLEIRALATGVSQPNALAASPGVLWAANNGSGLLQRFDTAG